MILCLWTASAVPGQNSPVFLKGGVEHSETLPAVPAPLQPGAVFQQGTLGTLPASEGWRRLPNCMAGSWEERNYILDKFQNFVTGASVAGPRVIQKHQTFVRGYQADNAGDIWDYPPARVQQIAETSTAISYISVRSREVMEISRERMVERATSLQIDVGLESHRIQRVLQTEQITTRQCIQPGVVRYTASIKSYSAQGTPMTLEEQRGEEILQKKFTRLNAVNGQDLKTSFVNYLASHGLAELIPKK